MVISHHHSSGWAYKEDRDNLSENYLFSMKNRKSQHLCMAQGVESRGISAILLFVINK